jgi:hypothetical protein
VAEATEGADVVFSTVGFSRSEGELIRFLTCLCGQIFTYRPARMIWVV